MKHLRIESLIIALGLVCAGAFIYFGIEAFGERSRTVEVRGFSERIVDADKATWPIRCKLRSDDVADIYNQAKSATDKIKTYLVNNGIDAKDITTSAPKVTDYRMQDWKPENVSSSYVADVTVTVSTKQVKRVHDLTYSVSDLMKQGIYVVSNEYGGDVTYEYTSLEKIKPEMIEASTKNAREAAEKFAKDSGSKLGKIKRATQGFFSIENRDEQTPWMKKVRVVTSVEYFLKN